MTLKESFLWFWDTREVVLWRALVRMWQTLLREIMLFLVTQRSAMTASFVTIRKPTSVRELGKCQLPWQLPEIMLAYCQPNHMQAVNSFLLISEIQDIWLCVLIPSNAYRYNELDSTMTPTYLVRYQISFIHYFLMNFQFSYATKIAIKIFDTFHSVEPLKGRVWCLTAHQGSRVRDRQYIIIWAQVHSLSIL